MPTNDGLASDLAGDALGLLVPFGGTAGKHLAQAVVKEWRRNRSTALRAAENASGLTREEFAEWAAQEPGAVPLYMKVLWAAGMNGHDQTLRAMGAVLGQAAKATAHEDQDGFAMAELALRAMGELTPRHFRVLDVLSSGKVVVNDGGGENYREFTPGYVAPKSGLTVDGAHQCMLNLAAAGLVVSKPVLEATAYPITDLGRAVVDAAVVAAAPPGRQPDK